MSVFNKKKMENVSVRLGVDSLTSNTWLIGEECETSSCTNLAQISKYKKDISTPIKINHVSGFIKGYLDEVDFNLNGMKVENLQIILVNDESFKFLEVT